MKFGVLVALTVLMIQHCGLKISPLSCAIVAYRSMIHNGLVAQCYSECGRGFLLRLLYMLVVAIYSILSHPYRR